MHEVYAYGVIAPSTLIELDGAFPSEAGYGEIIGIHPSLGGEAAGGAYVLARLGVATKLSGTRLSGEPESARVVEMLSKAGVDCSAVDTESTEAVTELVFSGNGERTVFGSYGRMLADRSWSPPSQADVASSRIVCLDPFFGEDSEQAARWCRESTIPYVTVDAPPDAALTRSAAAVIVAEEYASRTLPALGPDQVLATYLEHCEGLVVVTRGGGQILWGRGGEVQDHTPFPVEVRDTTGAGDSFRAGIIYAMLRGYDDERTIEVAAAVAALVCRTIPGVLGSPTGRELENFLARTD